MSQAYVIDANSTASEEFDGETIVIQFKTGIYSVLTGSGSEIFSMFQTPATVGDTVAAIEEAGTKDVEGEVQQFVADLLEAEILIEAAADNVSALTFTGTYETPGIEMHHDLADMMKVDPVHEVDLEQGWPKR